MITLHLRPELEAVLVAQTQAIGTTPEDYVRHLVEKDLSPECFDIDPTPGNGMVWEDGLLIYGAGSVLPDGFLDDAVRRSRDERSHHLLSLRLPGQRD